MELTFLSADEPLAKAFDKQKRVRSYPLVRNMTSNTVQVNDLKQMLTALKISGDQGKALLKGSLVRPIHNESRAGLTDNSKFHEYVVIDVDGGEYKGHEDLVAALPTEFQSSSYIVQYSSSYKITKKHFTGHLYFLLAKPIESVRLKDIIRNINVIHFKGDMRLNATNTAPLWPIDPSINESSRIIYIAPPLCYDFEDPVDERFALVEKVNSAVEIITEPATRTKVTRWVNDQRLQMGLGKFKGQIREHCGEQILTAVEPAIGYDYKVERDFVYFNINGGDSWGYFHPIGKPDLIYNFKGEPNYLTRELIPEYYEKVTGRNASETQRSYFAFRDFRSDQYYNGWYDAITDSYSLAATGSLIKIKHFLRQHGQPVADFIEDWTMEFDWGRGKTISFEEKWINRYQVSDSLRKPPEGIRECPPNILKLVKHICNGEEETAHFLNWLAWIFQNRKMPKTAWIFNGVEGTGKGVFFHRVLSKLVGPEYCEAKTIDSLEDSFNGYLEDCVFLMLDEFRVSDSGKSKSIIAQIKNLIVEPQISVRHMRQTSRMVPNFVCVIIASNDMDPMVIALTDRRFNVGNYQSERLYLTNYDLELIDQEVSAFAGYLMEYEVNEEWMQSPLQNAARSRLQNLTQTTIDECIHELVNGNFQFFMEQLPTNEADFLKPEVIAFRIVMQHIVTATLDPARDVVPLSRDQIKSIFDYCAGGMPNTPAKFTKLIKHRGLDMRPINDKGDTYRGITVDFKIEDCDEARQKLDLNVKLRSVS
jgi:hypothetical protein